MNIFALDNNPQRAAEYLCDKHVPKMLLESAQLLCTLARHYCGDELCDKAGLYKSSHTKHPCQLWLREAQSNWDWLYIHALAIAEQYDVRYNKRHKSHDVLKCAVQMLYDCPAAFKTGIPLHWTAHTPFVQCMPDEYKNERDPVTAYRMYYVYEKASFARWDKLGNTPQWYTELCNLKSAFTS